MDERTTGSGEEPVQQLLVVDDNPGDVRLVEEAFDGADLDAAVHAVTTGADALDFVYRRGEYGDAPRPDAVLLDWELPQTTGGEVLDELAADFPDVRFVVMTGSEPQTEAIEAEVTHADAFLTKPTEPGVYVETIRSLE